MTDTDKLRKEYRDKTGSTWNMTHEWYSQWLEKQLLEARTKLKNNCDLGNVVESCLDDDDDDFECYTCDICGSELTDGEKHAKGCPNDDSPYAEYLRNGFG